MTSPKRGGGGVSQKMTLDDMGGGGVQKGPILGDIIYEQPLIIYLYFNGHFVLEFGQFIYVTS